MFQTKMSEGGRVVIPAEIRQSLGLKEGDAVLFELRDGEAVITSRRAQLDRARALFRQYVPVGGPSIVDELIAERRAEAAQDDAEDAACRLGCAVLTADRAWLELAASLGLDIRCIRPD